MPSRTPTRSDLPPPPVGATAWPGTEESPQLPDTMPDGSPWPQVSVVTPSFNQGQFIEDTILSVHKQDYPRLEHIVIDGGSEDNTVDVLRRYDDQYNLHWVSEPDDGQSDAINKGWRRAQGDIIAYLNSDDRLEVGALRWVAETFLAQPGMAVVYGDRNMVNGKTIRGCLRRLRARWFLASSRNPRRQCPILQTPEVRPGSRLRIGNLMELGAMAWWIKPVDPPSRRNELIPDG